MTQSELVDALDGRLRGLLQTARDFKNVSTVEPQLAQADLASSVDELGDGIFDAESTLTRALALEAAARQVFYDIIRSSNTNKEHLVDLWNLLDIAIICAEQSQAEQNLTFYLIEDLIETQPTDFCRTVFDYLESRRERLLRKDFTKTYLVVIRFCNDLLRRLSRAEDAVFCGRVFFFLFQSFPLSDMSSVNLRGEFHIDNVTRFEGSDAGTQVDDDATANEPMDITENTDNGQSQEPEVSTSAGEANDETKSNEDDAFYTTFWKLQQDFANPTRLFTDAHFVNFQQALEKTVTKFMETELVVQNKPVKHESRGVKRKANPDEAIEVSAANYSTKYLTSRDLFNLELSDQAFHRHIMIQALIIIEFLLSLTEAAKRRVVESSTTNVNKSVMYSYMLTNKKRDWAASMNQKIAQYLQTGADGQFYYRMVSTILSRDKNWIRWKILKCPAIIRDAVTFEELSKARKAVKQLTVTRKLRAKPIGAVDPDFLTAVDNVRGLESLKDVTRHELPGLDELVNGIKTDNLDLEMAMPDETSQLTAAMDSKTWRATRSISRQSLGKLEKLDPTQKLTDVLDALAANQAPQIKVS